MKEVPQKFSIPNSKILISSMYIIGATLVFILGSVGTEFTTAIFTSFALNLLIVGLFIAKGFKFLLPGGFFVFQLFLIALFIHTHITRGDFKLFMIFASGSAFWFIFFNLRETIGSQFHQILYAVSIVMAFMFIKTLGTNINSEVSENLFHPTATSLHNHLGDIVAISLLPIIASYSKMKKLTVPVFLVGFSLIVLSYSRSALLALLAGVLYLNHKSWQFTENRKTLILFAFGASTLIFFGFSKATLSARPYYLQTLDLLAAHPYGVGVGNFSDFFAPVKLVHSMVLEIIAGMGVFSTIFIFWCLQTLLKILKNQSNLVFGSIFIGLFVNLALDRTYMVPTIVWLWLSSLGMIAFSDSKKV